MRFLVLFILIGAACVYGEYSVSYDGYKVYDVRPQTLAQGELLLGFHDNVDFDFWTEPRILNQSVTVMVSPQGQSLFENSLSFNGIPYNILINNVEETIQEEDARQRISPRLSLGQVTFSKYMSHLEMNAYLRSLAFRYPDKVTLVDFGRSFEGREMLLVEISSDGNPNKPTIFIDAGIHAREWIAPPVALYVINQLVENPGNAALLENINWAIIPCLNPDGYDYTQTRQRLWRKTRSPGQECYGTDPNRNFDYFWMETGASDQECSEVFAGPEPFSEIETRNLRDYLLDHRDTIKLYLNVHSYGSMLLYPWGYTADLPDDADELQALGEKVRDAIYDVRGTLYIVGSSTNVLYAAAGGADDYAKGAVGIELSYCVELPGGGSVGFNPPATSILGIVQEFFEGIKAYHEYIENKFAR